MRIVGRWKEMQSIIDFVERVVNRAENQQGVSNALFVSGMPGSGKSAVVSHVTKQLAHWSKAKGNIRLLELNAMHILEAKTIYSKIIRGLHGDTAAHCSASSQGDDRQKLLSQISTPGRKLILVVDEVDQLHTRDEEVLYDLFELSARPKSRLALVSIANSLNMTERFLPRLKESNALPLEVFVY